MGATPVAAGPFGLFGRRQCSSGTCWTPHDVQRAYYPQRGPDVYVVQNNNPAPLVAQGNTLYQSVGYQSAVLPFFDPNSYFEQELQLHKAADVTAALRSERTASLVERIVALQTPAIERIAAGQAAQMVLRASGLDPRHNSASASGVVISRNADGIVTVTQIDPVRARAYAAGAATSITTTTRRLARIATNGSYPMLTQFCAKCHGTQNASPKAGFYLGDSDAVARVMRDNWFKITKRVSKGSMPPAKAPQPTKEQRRAVLNDIESIITKHSS